MGTAFVRSPPASHNEGADGIDECLQSGGNYFSCRIALASEQDPVARRHLWRIAQAHAAGVSDYGKKGPPADMGGLPHAEVPGMCDPSKPCGDATGLNGAMECLALAFAQAGSDPAIARAAHAKACLCDPEGGKVPSYNTSAFICDAQGRPAFLAPDMKGDEAKDILDCALCHPKRGLAACERETKRLEPSDAALANHIATKHLRRCRTPNRGERTWAEYD
jgi:hypothetical protein